MKKNILIVIGIIIGFVIFSYLVYVINNQSKIQILMYHRVINDGDHYSVEIKEFEKQMKYLHDSGFTPIFLSEIDNYNDYKKPIVITFDDGWKDVYDNAYPILKKYNFKFNIFLITSLLNKDLYMTDDIVKELSKSDLVEIGSHTVSHNYLSSLSIDSQKEELSDSKNIIEELIGKNINTCAYPYGDYNDDTIEVVKDYYDYCVTTNRAFNSKDTNKLILNRYNIPKKNSLFVFKIKVNKLY